MVVLDISDRDDLSRLPYLTTFDLTLTYELGYATNDTPAMLVHPSFLNLPIFPIP